MFLDFLFLLLANSEIAISYLPLLHLSGKEKKGGSVISFSMEHNPLALKLTEMYRNIKENKRKQPKALFKNHLFNNTSSSRVINISYKCVIYDSTMQEE